MAIWLGKQYLDQCEPMEVRRLEFELQKFESKLNEQEQEADLDTLCFLNTGTDRRCM